MSKLQAIFGFLLCFGAGVGLMWSIDRSAEQQTERAEAAIAPYAEGSWNDGAASVPVSSEDGTWGARDAAVTVVEFSDYQCPHCQESEQVMRQLRARYGPAKVRIVWKHFPLPMHPQARPVHLAAQAVLRLGGHRAFWTFHEAAFASLDNQTPENLEAWAEASGVPRAAFRQALADPRTAAKVDADLALGRRLGVHGTPSFFVNGVELDGTQSFAKLAATVDAELAATAELRAAGVPANELYVRRTQARLPAALPASATATASAPADAGPPADAGASAANGDPGPAPADSPRKGPAKPKLVLQLFSGFGCPGCRRAPADAFRLVEASGGKVAVVWRNLPADAASALAAEAAYEVFAQQGSKAFWRYHDKLQSNAGKLAPKDLERYAVELGLDGARLRKALDARTHRARVELDAAAAARAGINAAPTLVVGKTLVRGATPEDELDGLVKRALQEAP